MSKKQKKVSKQITFIVIFLVILQILFIAYYNSKPRALTISQAIDNAVNKISDPRRREQARLFAAIKSYQGDNNKLPSTLNDLLPIYFEKLPVDPLTNKLFEYKVAGKKFTLGKNIDLDSSIRLPQNISKDQGDLSALNIIESSNVDAGFIFDSTGKRDPFFPFDFSPKIDLKNKSPLERFSLGQLKLTAVLEGFDQPQAIVETTDGKGFTVKKGMKIGTDNGIVVEIQPTKLLILESSVDFAGEKRNRTVELKLRTQDQEDKNN